MNDNYPIKGLDHLEFYVGNAKQAALVYSKCFGFTTTAYRGLETGDRKVTSYLLEQGEIRFVVSSALSPEYAIAQSVLKHGDTIAIIALEVSDANSRLQASDRSWCDRSHSPYRPRRRAWHLAVRCRSHLW